MEPEQDRMIATFVIQLTGTLFAFLSLTQVTSCTNIPSKLVRWMKLVVGGVVGVTIIIFILHKDIIQAVFSELPTQNLPSPFLNLVTCQIALFVYGVSDIVALGLLIYATGGSRHSIYLPYLLIIVPLIIMLKANYITVVMCFLLTSLTFWGCLFWVRNKGFTINEGRHHVYDIYFAIVTTLCVLFPIAVKVFAM